VQAGRRALEKQKTKQKETAERPTQLATARQNAALMAAALLYCVLDLRWVRRRVYAAAQGV
jgi:hypothetical protein